MRYVLQKSPFYGENIIEIDAEICMSLLELGYIRNLLTCQSENCSYFFTAQRRRLLWSLRWQTLVFVL